MREHVLVTGATGFLGGAVAVALQAQGYSVRCTGRSAERGARLRRAGLSFVPAELSAERESVALCAGIDAVVHCAALSSPWGPQAAFERANVTATRHILAGCERHGVRRLVHISTPSLYMGAGDFVEATRRFPERLYALLTPVTIPREQAAVAQLRALGYEPTEVCRVYISHFHADHISALSDFPRARFYYFEEAFAAVRRLGRVRALMQGILPALLPPDFVERSVSLRGTSAALPADCQPFVEGLDLFGDGSGFAVRLPGHAPGQLGLIVSDARGRRVFLVADACWTRAAFEQGARPHPITHLLFDDSAKYHETLARLSSLHARYPDTLIVPSHCEATFLELASTAP